MAMPTEQGRRPRRADSVTSVGGPSPSNDRISTKASATRPTAPGCDHSNSWAIRVVTGHQPLLADLIARRIRGPSVSAAAIAFSSPGLIAGLSVFVRPFESAPPHRRLGHTRCRRASVRCGWRSRSRRCRRSPGNPPRRRTGRGASSPLFDQLHGRTFGAPTTCRREAGRHRVQAVRPSASIPITVDTRCITWL